MTPYDEGQEAYFDDGDIEDNPYPEWDQLFEEWDMGFLEAAEE